MSVVIAAIVLVGALCLLDLLLTFGVLRRLREQSAELERLSAGGAGGVPEFDRDALVGRTLPQPAATTIGEAPVAVVGFFAAGCEPCHKQAPELVAWASGQAGERAGARAVAVVTGTGAGADELVEIFGDAVIIIAGPDGSRVATELGISVYPTFVRTGAGGAIVEAAFMVHDVLEPSRV